MYLKTIFIFFTDDFPISISNAQEKLILLMNFEGIDVTTVF